MGRKNKAYYKDLHQQAYDRLTEMLAFGESKKEAVAAGTEKDKIFSVNTYKSYWKHIKYFLRYIKQKHPECTTLKGAKSMSTNGFRAERMRSFPRGRCSWRRRRSASFTRSRRTTRTISSRPSGIGRTSSAAAATACATNTFRRRTTTS